MSLCPNTSSPEWQALVVVVGTFEAYRDWAENNNTIRDPEVVKQKLSAPQLIEVYQGYNKLDNRNINYFTSNSLEAISYGEKIRKSIVNTKDFLKRRSGNDQEYFDLVDQWEKKSGVRFDIFDNTSGGLKQQARFFEFLQKKGYKGIDMIGGEDSNYIVTFSNTALPLYNILKSYNANDQGFLPGTVNPDAVKISLSKAGLTDYHVRKTSTGGYYITDEKYLPVTSYFREARAKAEFLDSPIGNSSHENQLPFELNPTENDKTRANEILHKLAESLSTKHGINYDFISVAKAAELTKNTKVPWNGEPAFFIRGSVYFITDHLTTNMIFHEFSHPLIRSLAISNPITFDNIFNDLSGTSEGQGIISTVESLYPELGKDTDAFREEVIVRALSTRADNIRNGIKDSPEFKSFTTKLLYHIKQLLRKLFNVKIKVENLSESTTLNELADMLVNERFQISTQEVSQEDIAAYVREQKEQIADILKVKDLVQPFVDMMYKATLADPVRALERLNDSQMLDLLSNDVGTELLKQMRGNISKFRTEIRKRMTEKIDEVKYLNNQSEQFISNLFILKDIMKNLSEEMMDLKDAPESKDNLIRAQYITDFVKYWESYLDHVDAQLASGGLLEDSPLRQLISQTEDHINKGIKRHIDPIFKKGLTTMLSTVLKPMQQRADKIHEDHIKKLTAKGAAASLIKSEKEAYDKLRISPEKLFSMLSGYDDASMLNTWLEPWMYSSDLVTGGFAAFLKNNLNDVLSNTHDRWGSFVKGITPLLKDAGYSPNQVASLAKIITFVDAKDFIADEDGNMIKQDVYTFLNPYKDYRYVKAELQHRITEADKLPDRALYNQLILEEKDLNRWFWRDYTDEYYEREELFNTPVGIKAKQARDDIFSQINTLQNTVITEADFIEVAPQIQQLWKLLRQLYSLKDLNDEYKKGEDLEIARTLQQYREISRQFFQYSERPGLFQGKLSQYEQQLSDQGFAPGSAEFIQRRQDWLDANTVQAVKPEFYQVTSQLYDQIKAIYESVPNPSQSAIELVNTYKEIRDTLSGYRDDDGQPVGSDMGPKTLSKIKDLQERTIKLQRELRSGLTEDEQSELDELFGKLNDTTIKGPKFTANEQLRFDDLMSKGSKDGLSKFQRAHLSSLWQQLATLQGKEATEYYIDVFNNFLSKADVKEIADLNKVGYIDKDTADFVINLPATILNKILKADPQFAKWFKENHIRKEYFDPGTKKRKKKWERIAAWSIVRPLNPEFMERTSVLDENGNVSSIQGKPSMRFYKREVKPEFHTKQITGVTKDIKGNWLPKSKAQGAPDDRFINQAYYDLQRNNPEMFALLEKIKEHYLAMQVGADRYAQMGYDIPRFRKESLELIQTPGYSKGKISTLQGYLRNIKAYFTKAKDDVDMGYNPSDEAVLADTDFFSDHVKKIPVSGIYNLDIKDVSQDILGGIARYMAGIERQKKLKEIHPLARALKSVLENPDNYARDMKRINEKNFNLQHVQKLPKKRGRYVRAEAVKNLMDREFYGQQYAGLFHDNKGVNAAMNLAFKGASFSYLAVQLPSAITNMLVQMVQNVIESASGENFNPSDLAYGTMQGTKAMTEISMEIYKVGSHSLAVQLTEIFDAIPGRSIGSTHGQRLGTSLSRTFTRDAVTLSYLYSPRKFMENEATLQAFYAMMRHTKIKQTINNQTKEISYDQAWELDKDNKIVLKPGIDPSYAQGGDKFNEVRNRQEIVQYKMNGAYDHFGQPEAQRYLLFRMISFLRRYVTTMLTNRWGFTRHNPGMMDVQTGYYIESLKASWKTIITGGKYLSMMTKSEAGAFRKLFAELGILTLMHFMYGLLFGWDPDDDNKYNELRSKSGPLPVLGVAETGYPFEWGGWLSNHMLLQLMKTEAQTQMWIPTPGMGLKDYTDLTQLTPIAFGPTLQLYGTIVNDLTLMATGKDRAYYQRTVGPYEWQQQGKAKILNHMASIPGFRGVTMEPILGIQKAQSMRVRQ